MDTRPIKKSRRRSNAHYQTSFLPKDLIAAILCLLSIKNIVQLKCVSKSWNALISDPTFIEKHLKKSSQNPHLTLFWNKKGSDGCNILPFPVLRLLKNPSVYTKKFHHLKKNCRIVGSCNGLLCLLFNSRATVGLLKYWLRFWNPATGTRSKKLGLLCVNTPFGCDYRSKFTFGYDASTRTYKVVVIRAEKSEASWKSEVKVFSLGDNRWRNIKSFNMIPVNWFHYYSRNLHFNDGVHLSGTINWLTNEFINNVSTSCFYDGVQFRIVSLDLSTETYKHFQLPLDFDGVPFVLLQPALRVFMDSLCFSHDSNETELVFWQMKEYGVQESWTQLFKIRYQDIKRDHNIRQDIWDRYQLAFIYVNGDMVIFANAFRNGAFTYNLKDRTVEAINTRYSIQ